VKDTTGTGRAGEFLAAYLLETFGVEVHHVDRDGADLWCRVGGGLSTVQVKTSSAPRLSNKTTVSPRYEFHTPETAVDWFCFVALDCRLILMRRADMVGSGKTRIRPQEFNEANQRRTVEEFLNGFSGADSGDSE
jgi:hypothetical protein